jgi:hypothetical protein
MANLFYFAVSIQSSWTDGRCAGAGVLLNKKITEMATASAKKGPVVQVPFTLTRSESVVVCRA